MRKRLICVVVVVVVAVSWFLVFVLKYQLHLAPANNRDLHKFIF